MSRCISQHAKRAHDCIQLCHCVRTLCCWSLCDNKWFMVRLIGPKYFSIDSVLLYLRHFIMGILWGLYQFRGWERVFGSRERGGKQESRGRAQGTSGEGAGSKGKGVGSKGEGGSKVPWSGFFNNLLIGNLKIIELVNTQCCI